jgi:hypothetical protein
VGVLKPRHLGGIVEALNVPLDGDCRDKVEVSLARQLVGRVGAEGVTRHLPAPDEATST